MHKRIDPAGYGIHKGKAARLLPNYEWFFAPLVGKDIALLELGVDQGASVHFWRDYFENATIVGVDRNPPSIGDQTGSVWIYQGYQQDTELLDRIAHEHAPDGFDVVIDDCAHVGRLARVSFWHLFQNHLKPGGVYAIEDWGTGYMPWWPDGRTFRPLPGVGYGRRYRVLDRLTNALSRAFPRAPRLTRLPSRLIIGTTIRSHTHGMAGFVKELLDVCILGDATAPPSGAGRYRAYGISQVHVFPNLVIVAKSTDCGTRHRAKSND